MRGNMAAFQNGRHHLNGDRLANTGPHVDWRHGSSVLLRRLRPVSEPIYRTECAGAGHCNRHLGQPSTICNDDRAAKTLGKNRTHFVLDAARRAAEDALLDRTVLAISPKAYAEFLARLDAPPRPNERLHKTLRTAAPWK